MNHQDDLTKLDLQSLWHPMRQHRGIAAEPPRQFVSGDGVYLTDIKGQRVLDGVAGIWCVNVGYGREELADVARDQMARLPYLPGTFAHAPAAALARSLTLLRLKMTSPSRVDWSVLPRCLEFVFSITS